MWPFARKQFEPKSSSRADQAIEQIRAWRAIGESFNYLGYDCFVSSYSQLDRVQGRLVHRVRLSADYRDGKGRIRHISFNWPQIQALMQKIP